VITNKVDEMIAEG
jgi:hypothetical protein